VEITTRITSSALHHLSGREEGAVKSVVSLFATARELMRKNPCATEFLSLASALLETVRPYTARWHALVDDEEKFLGAPQRAQFRAELAQLQERLEPFVEALDEMRKTGASSRPPATPAPTVPQLGADVPLGIDPRHVLPATSSAQPPAALTPREAVELMNALEAQHVCRRRELDYDSLRKPLNATGLALSGGGIRSATFCLGVVTVLAEAKLLRGFDYLSTVSGGGYLGSFLSNQFTAADARGKEAHADVTGREFAAREAARTAYGEVFLQGHESAPVRHLRNSSKYLLPATTSERLKLLGLLISGVMATTLLTAFVPVSLAYLVYWLDQWGSLARFGLAAAVFAILAGVWWLLRPITAIWRRSERIDKWAGWAITFAALLATIAATPWVLALLQKAESWNWNWKLTSASLASIVTALSGAVVVKAIGAAWKYRRALSRLFILSGVLFFVVIYLITLQLLANEEPAFSVAQYAVAWTQCIAGVLLIWLVWALFVNLNLTGLHRYYRDRLASCYLQDPSDGRGIQHPPRLDQLADKLPYHLINTTVNLTSSRNPELRGRGGDFFLLSKYVCGSQVTGYQATERVSQMNPDLDLATAMAISGAAASTNMGTLTLRQYRTLMAIFNVRLEYWLRWRRDRHGW
jgi:hypothetical protein